MRIKIPFTDTILYLGKKEVSAVKQSLMYGSYQNNFQTFIAGGGYRISYETLYLIYNNVVDVKQAIKKLQNSTLKEGFTTVDINRPDKDGDVTQTKALRDIIDRKDLTFQMLVSTTIRDLNIMGNAYWHLLKNAAGQVLGIEIVDPRTMTILADEYGNVKEYIQYVCSRDVEHFQTEEIIHLVTDFSTDNPLFGVSPIESIVWEAKAEMAAQMSNLYFYENNAVPSHLLIMEENLSDDQLNEIRNEIDLRFKGTKNKFKSGIIPFLKDVKTISPSQKEMEFIATRSFSTKKVVVAFGVDPFILGYTEKVQRGNAEVVYSTYYQDTIRPIEVYLEAVINNKLLPALGLDRIKFVANLSNYDDEQRVWDSTRLDTLAGILTINEARNERGYDNSDNELADELMVNGLLLDDLGAETTAFSEAVKAKRFQHLKDLDNLLKL